MQTVITQNQMKSVSNKLGDIDIERFSISSFNAFRRNRFTWYLRYVADFKSRWPMEGAWRGNAIESAVMRSLMDPVKESLTMEKLVGDAINVYQREVVSHLLHVFPKGLENFSDEKIEKIMMAMDKTQFPQVLKTIVDVLYKLNMDEDLPEYVFPESEDYSKYLKKVEKQYSLIESAVPYAVEYFKSIPGTPNYQTRLLYHGFKLGLPVIGFTDFEYTEFGIDLKTSGSIPKKWEDVSLDYKCQAAFYSVHQKKPWKIVYVGKLNQDQIKENLITKLHHEGLSSKEIMVRYKEITGSGTTEPTVSKILDVTSKPDWEPHKPLKEFLLPESETAELNEINRFTGLSILQCLKSSRRDNLLDDMKYFCIGDLDHIFLDKDQSREIAKVWGFKVPTTEEE
ncbi:hypothetical protein [Leptospira perdikensis]|uniref:PD-(D/E)XK endonuclease-like domain-containing protein n=1 Tax=Leptospira perdikensis TaxID=2484948 RepID=A0A4R9JCC0_9LEPT|nr:hypothetical protein [Leptospira perdikensis]TGL35581.1 hypothetical protein EHQ49_17550 [Leptospira perdikensis]